VELVAQAHDPEDGFLDGDGITWSSSLDGDLDGARTLNTRELSVGDHVIKAVATDSDGSASEATLPIKVVDRGRAEPRAEGAEPLAETILRAAVPEEKGSNGAPVALIVGVVVVALLGAAAFVVLRRRKPGEPS
jgi:LPXTG-motif cell wall-anchored protein